MSKYKTGNDYYKEHGHARVWVSLPLETHEFFKERAKLHERTLQRELRYELIQLHLRLKEKP